MDISVVIPVRNRGHLLKLCLESLVSQRKGLREIIIVDNHSKDPIKTIVDSYKEVLPVQYIFEQKEGPSSARNTGIKDAQAEIIAFLDSDCLPTPNWVQSVIKSHQKNREENYFLQGASHNQLNSQNIFSLLDLYQNELYDQLRKINDTEIADPKNLSVRTSVLKRGLLFDSAIPQYAEDIDYSLRLKRKGLRIIPDKAIKVIHLIDSSFSRYFTRRFRSGLAYARLSKKWRLNKKKSVLPKQWQRLRNINIDKTSRRTMKEICTAYQVNHFLFSFLIRSGEFIFKLGYIFAKLR